MPHLRPPCLGVSTPTPDLTEGDRLPRLLRAGLLTALSDGLFASVLNVAIYNSTVTRLWQGVAAVLLGRGAFEGGTRTAAIGLLMHFIVAFWWSAVFLFLVLRWSWVRRLRSSPWGMAKIAALYGPLIWLVMSLVVIPLLVQRPPSFTTRWWIQFIGHFPFVGLPLVAAATWGWPATDRTRP